MTLGEFERTLAQLKPPVGLSPALVALWWAGRDQWDKAHQIVMDEGDRPGVVNVSDSIVQAAGLNLAPTGTTTVAQNLRSGTFVLRSGQKRVTGNWTCV